MNENHKVTPWVRAAFILLGVFAIVCGIKVLDPVLNSLSMLPRDGIVDYPELL